MTNNELMALRDVTPYFGQREEIRDGKRVTVPVQSPDPGALWTSENEPAVVTDSDGIDWAVGWLNGEYVRRRWGW